MLKKWAEGEFKGDSQLSLIPSLYSSLKRDGIDFRSGEQENKASVPKDPNVVSSAQEEEDIAKAIQMSLQDAKSSSSPRRQQAASANSTATSASSSLYPSASGLTFGFERI